jgi:hypothetical protein
VVAIVLETLTTELVVELPKDVYDLKDEEPLGVVEVVGAVDDVLEDVVLEELELEVDLVPEVELATVAEELDVVLEELELELEVDLVPEVELVTVAEELDLELLVDDIVGLVVLEEVGDVLLLVVEVVLEVVLEVVDEDLVDDEVGDVLLLVVEVVLEVVLEVVDEDLVDDEDLLEVVVVEHGPVLPATQMTWPN